MDSFSRNFSQQPFSAARGAASVVLYQGFVKPQGFNVDLLDSRRAIVIFVPLISANHHGSFVKRVIRSTKGSQLLDVVQPFQPVAS